MRPAPSAPPSPLEPAEPEPRRARRARLAVLPLLLACAAAALARLASWRQVFASDGVRMLFDSDPNYHLLQAARALANGLTPAWFDPGLSWPNGASVLWPPLWDLAIAGAARAVYGASPTMAQLERTGAILPVVVGVATVPIVASLSRRLLGRETPPWVAALLFALLGSNVVITVLGRPDQHAAEILLHAALMALFAAAATAASGRAVAMAGGGIALGLAFWNWQGSALDLLVPCLCAALAHLVLDRRAASRVAAALAGVAGAGALVLAASIAAWGPAGALRRGGIAGITGLPVAVAAGAAVFGAGLALAARLSPEARRARRAGEVALAAAVAAVAGLGWSSEIRTGILHGLTALGAANPWFETISEYRPVLFSCEGRLADDLLDLLQTWGLVLPVAALALPSLARRWRGGARAPVLVLSVWAAVFLVLALLRRRLGAYLCIPAALLAADGLVRVVRRADVHGRWRPTALAAGALLLTFPCLLALRGPMPHSPQEHLDAARWLRTQPLRKGQEGVLTPWELGHVVLYYARRPVVVSPFGTDLGLEAMAFASAVRLAKDPARAEELLLGRRVGYLVLENPAFDVLLDERLAPPGTPRYATLRCGLLDPPMNHIGPDFDDVAAARLFYYDGLTRERPGPPFTRLRLVWETPAIGTPSPPLASLKIYEVVPGAGVLVTGARPGSDLRVEARIRTDSGRAFTWSAGTRTPPDGTVLFRVPYASGPNGAGRAELTLREDGLDRPLALANDDVLEGRTTRVRLEGRSGVLP
jgi:asparagine N-glycosylation enzyme membrane subunit Stt3